MVTLFEIDYDYGEATTEYSKSRYFKEFITKATSCRTYELIPKLRICDGITKFFYFLTNRHDESDPPSVIFYGFIISTFLAILIIYFAASVYTTIIEEKKPLQSLFLKVKIQRDSIINIFRAIWTLNLCKTRNNELEKDSKKIIQLIESNLISTINEIEKMENINKMPKEIEEVEFSQVNEFPIFVEKKLNDNEISINPHCIDENLIPSRRRSDNKNLNRKPENLLKNKTIFSNNRKSTQPTKSIESLPVRTYQQQQQRRYSARSQKLNIWNSEIPRSKNQFYSEVNFHQNRTKKCETLSSGGSGIFRLRKLKALEKLENKIKE